MNDKKTENTPICASACMPRDKQAHITSGKQTRTHAQMQGTPRYIHASIQTMELARVHLSCRLHAHRGIAATVMEVIVVQALGTTMIMLCYISVAFAGWQLSGRFVKGTAPTPHTAVDNHTPATLDRFVEPLFQQSRPRSLNCR